MTNPKALRFIIGFLPAIMGLKVFQNRRILSIYRLCRSIGILLFNSILNPRVILPQRHYFQKLSSNFDGNSPLVSIILPVYNHGEFLRDAIQSILKQDYENFELIIVNDGSTDSTNQILEEFSTNNQITIIRQENLGLPIALNSGFTIAKGVFLTWTSADNLMAPAALSVLVNALKKEKSVGLVYADYTVVDVNGHEIGRDNTWRNYDRTGKDPSVVKLGNPRQIYRCIPINFIGPYFLYRSEIADRLTAYGNIPGIEDWDYWLRMQFITKFRHIKTDGKQYLYRIHSNSMSSKIKASNQMLNTVLLFRNIAKDRLGAETIEEKISPGISEKHYQAISKESKI
jgi:glycosyltransferase involved in cell wall biosynthesis